jgi:hypothetical protein
MLTETIVDGGGSRDKHKSGKVSEVNLPQINEIVSNSPDYWGIPPVSEEEEK